MDSVLLSENSNTLAGLSDMLEHAIGPHDYIHSYVEISTALFIVEIAKRAKDKHNWFPRGKWATIQSIQNTVNKQLDLLKEPGE